MAKRVLAIDDSEIALAVIREALEPHNIELIATETPGEFFRTVYAQPQPDLIITDMEMPSIAGSDICRQMKNDDRTKAIPLVILSTLPTSKLAPTARLLGADRYLCKADFTEEHVSSTLLPLLGIEV